MTISERLFDLLSSTPGKNAAGLSRVLGVGTSQTTSWKQRNADPPAKYIAQICEYLGVSVMYLLTGESEQSSCGDVQAGASEQMAEDEVLLLERYRSLDTDGKEVVRVAALQEQRRVLLNRGVGEVGIG